MMILILNILQFTVIKLNKARLMYNPFVRQFLNENDFRVQDFRNGTYQGQVLSNTFTREGFGIVLDNNFLLALGNWKNNLLIGQSFIIFPDQTYFYGNISNSLPSQLCCYHGFSNLNIYSMLWKSGENLILFDDLERSTLQKVVISENLMNLLTNEPKVNEKVLVQKQKLPENSKEIIISVAQQYENSSSKWNLLENMLNTKTNQQQKSFQAYIKHVSAKNAKVQTAKVEVVENKQCFQFSFKNSSIKCKYTYSSPNNMRLKNLGFYQTSSSSYSILKKYNYENDTIQQNINGKTFVYPRVPLIRPDQCFTYLHKHYKQSLNFVNQYLNIDYLYRIKFVYTAFQQLFQSMKSKNVFQLYEIEAKQNNRLNDSINKGRQNSNDSIHQQDLRKIKQNVYRMASKQHSSGKKKDSFDSPPAKGSFFDWINFRSKSAQQAHIKRIGSISNFKHKNTQELQKKIKNRSAVYLEQSSIDFRLNSIKIESIQNQTEKKLEKKAEKKAVKRQFEGFLSKFAYLEEQSREINKKKVQNIKTLTQRYLQIQKELKKGNIPNSNFKDKGKRYNHSRQVTQFNLAKTYNKQKDQTIIKGPKRILRYGWD